MKNKFIRKLYALVFSAALLSSSLASQEKDSFIKGGTLDFSVTSQYLAGKAGFIVEDEPVAQTYTDFNTRFGNFYVWSNSLISSRETSELDLGWVSPGVTSTYFGTNLAVSTYTYPNTKANWKNWDLEAGANFFTKNLPLDINLYVATSLTANKDSSNLAKLTVGRQFSILEFKSYIQGGVVYSDNYYSEDEGFSHVTIKAELSKEITKNTESYIYGIVQEELSSFEKVEDSAMIGGGIRYRF